MARPLREVIRNVALAIAEGQADLDRNAVAVQRDLERALENGDASDVLELPHYRFSEVDVDLEATLSIGAKPDRKGDEGEEEDDREAYQPTLIAGLEEKPTKKKTVNSQMTSKVKFKIVPTAPPKRDGGTGQGRTKTADQQTTSNGEPTSNGGDA